MSEPDDKTLVSNCLAGDKKAFEQLVDRYQKVLFNVSLRMLNDHEDAMDVTQIAFVKAYEKLDTYNSKYKFFSWIYKIMINESLNLIKRRKPNESVDHDLISPEKNPDQAYDDDIMAGQVQAAVASLPLDYRRLIVLRHFGNLSYRDMSGALDIPEKTIKSRLYTARQMLKELLQMRGEVRA